MAIDIFIDPLNRIDNFCDSLFKSQFKLTVRYVIIVFQTEYK